MEYCVGALSLRIRIEHSGSLKDKRQVLRSLKDRLRRRHNVAVAEVAGQHSWHESVVTAATVSGTVAGVRRVLDAVERDAEQALGRELHETARELFEG